MGHSTLGGCKLEGSILSWASFLLADRWGYACLRFWWILIHSCLPRFWWLILSTNYWGMASLMPSGSWVILIIMSLAGLALWLLFPLGYVPFCLPSFFSFYLVFLLVMIFKCGDHFRAQLAQLLVVLLTLLTCLGRSTLMVLMGLLEGVLLGVTQMS